MSMLEGRQQFLIMLDIGASESTVSVYIRIDKEADANFFHSLRQADIVLTAGFQPTLGRNQPLFRINANYDFAASKALQHSQVIASGGIQSADDLEMLKKLGLAGAIVGKAYYSGRISLEQIKEAERG